MDQRVPIETYYGYTYSQSIYLASEINASGTINSIQWYFNGSSALANSQDVVVYIGTTSKSVFASDSDWEAGTNLTQVYAGGITGGAPGWVTITFDAGFVYDGTSNLVVAVEENMPGYDDNGDEGFYNFQVAGKRSLCYYSDTVNAGPDNAPEANFSSDYVPNIIFDGITQACATPFNIVSSNIGTTTATIAWDPSATVPSGGSQYYTNTSPTPPTASTTPSGSVASGETADITSGLLPATTYYVWVRNNCGSGVYSAWSSFSKFTTACVAITDFNENFDSVTTPLLPTCWTSILRGDGLSEYASVGTATGESVHSDPNSVLLYNSDTDLTTNDVILVSPNLSNIGAATHRIKFYAKGAGSLQVGTLDGNSDTAVFTSYQDITTTDASHEYTVDFSGYSGVDTYIGIRLSTPSSYSNVYVDNVLWEVNPSCPDVINITATDITTAGATINWEAGGSEASWNVAVGATTVTDPSTLTFVSATDITKNIIGLTDNTTYKAWVRSVCAGGDNGAWIGPITFTTECLPIATFNENFDSVSTPNLPSCWTSILRGPSLSDYASVGTYDTSNAHSAPNMVQLYNSSSDNSTDDIILVSPNLSTLAAGTHRLKFYAQYGDNLQVGTLDANNATATFTPLQEVIPTGTLAEYTVDFTSYTGTDHYVGIRLNTTETYISSYVDDIRWELAPTCPDVTGIVVSSVSTSGATIDWTAGGSEASWDIAVGAPSVTDPSTLTFVTSTVATKTISGLTDATNYKVWVRSVCAGSDNGAWIGPVSFKTDCLAVANFNENFDSTNYPNLPSCWTKILRGPTLSTSAYIQTDTNDVHSTPNSVTLYNSSSSPTDDDIILVSPNLSTLSLGTYRLKFYARNAGKLQIGTLDSSTGAAVFSPVEEVTTTDDTVLYKIDFSPYLGTDKYIGIRLANDDTYTSVYLDDIIWEIAPTCPDVDAIEVVDITTATANVNWTSGGSETNWQVTFGASTQTDPNAATNTTVNASTLTTTPLSGLTDATSYNLWVRSMCSGSDNGAWIGPIKFMTLCNATSAPYTEDFETSVNEELPGCTQSLNVGTGNNWHVGDNPGYGFSSKTLTYSYDFDNAADTWFFTRGINLTAGTTYNVSYRYGNNSETQYTESMKVMIGNSPTADGMTEPFADYPAITGAIANTEALQYTPTTTGVYYLGFNAYSIANQYYLYVDDISVSTSLATGQFDVSKFNYYPNPVKDILNISYIKDISAVSVYNLLGQEVLVKSINNKNALINMSALPSGTYMVKVTADNLVKTVKVIKQ